MAKKHKYANNGVALDTALSIEDLRAICAQAATESTGDLWNGSHRIVEGESVDDQTQFVVQGSVTGWNKFMTFVVMFSSSQGRTTLATEIDTYRTIQQTVMFIPVSPKKMVARHTYLQFINKVANTVRHADPTARVALSEGEWMAGAAFAPAGATSVLPPNPPPSAVIVASVEAPSSGYEVADRTLKVPRKQRTNHWLVKPHGLASLPLVTSAVLGRQPSLGNTEGAIIVVPIGENTVSKRHAKLELVNNGVYITDLGSSNGTILVGPGDEIIHCELNIPTPIPIGYTIELGDYVVSIEAPAGIGE